MTAAAEAPAAAPWSVPVRIGGVDYTAHIPMEYRTGSPALVGVEFADDVAPSVLGHLAAELTAHTGADGAVWAAAGVLLGKEERNAIMLRVLSTDDPLTLGMMRAGMLEAVKALAAVIPRPRLFGGGEPSTVVEIAGRPYTATVPPELAGMPAASVAGHVAAGPEVGGVLELVDAVGPAGVPAGGPRLLGLLLFSEAVLRELDARVADEGDPCTGEDVAAGVHLALERLADAGPGPFGFDGVSLASRIDATVAALEFAERASPVVLAIGGADYRVGWPPVWALFLEAVAAMGPLTAPRGGVEAVRLEGLAVVVARALPMVFSAIDVEALAAQIDDEADDLDVVGVAEAICRALLALDAEARGCEATMARLSDDMARHIIGEVFGEVGT